MWTGKIYVARAIQRQRHSDFAKQRGQLAWWAARHTHTQLPARIKSSKPYTRRRTCKVFNADESTERHQRVMIQMQKGDLILLLSENEEDGVQQLDDFAHVIQPNGTCHLRIHGNEKAYSIHKPRNHSDDLRLANPIWPIANTRGRLQNIIYLSPLVRRMSRHSACFSTMNFIPEIQLPLYCGHECAHG